MKNNSENTITKGAWFVEKNAHKAFELPMYEIESEDKNTTQWIAQVLAERDDNGNGLANAEHIVKCVNSHDELVAALRQAMQYLFEETIVSSHPHFFKHANEVLKKANAELFPVTS